MWLGLWFACAPPQSPEVDVYPSGVHVRTNSGLSSVRIFDSESNLLSSHQYPVPLEDVDLEVFWPQSGQYRLEVSGASHQWRIPIEVALSPLGFELSGGIAGQVQSTISDKDTLDLAVIGDAEAQWTLTVHAWRDEAVQLRTAYGVQNRQLSAGESWTTWHHIDGAGSYDIGVCGSTGCENLTLMPHPLALSESDKWLRIEDWAFPSDATGAADLVLPDSELWLPAGWWQDLLSTLGLGFRARDPWAPIAFEGVTLFNQTETALSVLVDTRVLDEDGIPEPLFRPRVREGSSPDGRSRVLLSVPPQQTARAVLPIYFDGLHFDDPAAEWTMELRISVLGHSSPLLTQSRKIHVQRAQGWVSMGFALAISASLLGGLLLLIQGRSWLERSSSTLSSIAMFAALESVTRLVVRVAGIGAAAILGPFSLFVTALPDQIIRFSILGALIGLLPYRGVAALMLLVGWLLNSVLTGSMSVVGLGTLLGEVFWLELMLWLMGITRGRTGALRFVLAMLGFSVLSSACGYALHMVFYRLFYHPAYLAAVLLGPACLYVAIAAWVGLQLTHSLARVQR